jgi:hypothetical protein
VISSFTDDETLNALDRAQDALGPHADLALDAAHLWTDLARSQQPDLERLRSLGPPVAEVPLIGVEHHDLELTRRIAEVLGAARA